MVRWSDSVSKSCKISNGVKQGGILSPILFIVYIDVLLCQLSSCGFGCFIGDLFCGAMGYADDVALLSPTVSGMDKLLNVCSSFAKEYDVKFNASKSKVLAFECNDSSKYVRDVKFTLMGSSINQSNIEKHLGHIVGNKVKRNVIDHAIAELNIRTNMLFTQFKCVPYTTLYSLFKCYCMSMYGCPLWDMSHNYCRKFSTAWRKNIRRLLKIPNTTHSNLLPLLCDDMNIDCQLHCRFKNFIKSCRNSPNNMVNTCVKLAISGSGSTCSSNISLISWRYRIPRCNIHLKNAQIILYYDDEIAIKASVIRDLMDMRHQLICHENNFFDIDEITTIITTLCID